MEHYVDGDLVDDTYPTNRQKASPDNLHVWGKLTYLLLESGIKLITLQARMSHRLSCPDREPSVPWGM